MNEQVGNAMKIGEIGKNQKIGDHIWFDCLLVSVGFMVMVFI